MSNLNSRAIAATILCDVLSGSGSLTTHLKQQKDSDDYPLLQETCFGCCRWFYLLDHLLSLLVTKPIKTKDQDIRCLLIVGLYQLRELSVAEYAVINETVSAAKMLGKPWAKALVNAVLRNYLRKKEGLEKQLGETELGIRTSHPQWLVAEIARQWPQFQQQILESNNQRPPMTLRVNLSKQTREQFLARLGEFEIRAVPGQFAASAVYLEKPMPVGSIPGFDDGEVSVQDEASQLVPELLQLEAGNRVLDACAAPGGKTYHILESKRSLTSCVSLDMSQDRLARISENLDRLGLQAELICADAGKTEQWWDNQAFDRILLDAPCSATGVIRRHPDIKLLRAGNDISSQVHTQEKLITALWQCLKPGGLLLYTSCSILKQENEELIDRFLQANHNAKYEGIAADWGVECHNGRQLLPGASNGPDGFFFSLLRKV